MQAPSGDELLRTGHVQCVQAWCGAQIQHPGPALHHVPQFHARQQSGGVAGRGAPQPGGAVQFGPAKLPRGSHHRHAHRHWAGQQSVGAGGAARLPTQCAEPRAGPAVLFGGAERKCGRQRVVRWYLCNYFSNTIFAEISAHQKQWFFKGGSTQNRWAFDGWCFQRGEYTKPMGFWWVMFSKGGVHKTDGFWWVIFQRGEYTKPYRKKITNLFLLNFVKVCMFFTSWKIEIAKRIVLRVYYIRNN